MRRILRPIAVLAALSGCTDGPGAGSFAGTIGGGHGDTGQCGRQRIDCYKAAKDDACAAFAEDGACGPLFSQGAACF